MKRIEAALKDKLNDSLIKNKVEKISIAIKAADTNFDEQIINADIRIEEELTKVAKNSSVENLISNLSDAISCKKAAQEGKKRLAEIKKYLEEDITVEEEVKK